MKDQRSFLNTMGQVTGAIGATTGLLGALGVGSGRQLKQQQRLNEQAALLNYQYNEMAANNAFQRQNQMYNKMFYDNSPASQVQRLKDAGLSVGLMYGGSGTTGSATASTAPQGSGSAGSAQPGQAPKSTERMAQAAQLALMGKEIAKLDSEIELNKAHANEANADAQKTSGVDTENVKINTEIQKINLNIKQQTFTQEIVAKTLDNIQKSENINLTTEKAKQIKEQTELLTAQVAKTLSETELNILEKAWKNQEIAQGWAKIAIAKQQVAIAQDANDIKREQQTLDKEIANLKARIEYDLKSMEIDQKDRTKILSAVIRGVGAIPDAIEGTAADLGIVDQPTHTSAGKPRYYQQIK